MKYAEGESYFSRVLIYNGRAYSSLLGSVANGANRVSRVFSSTKRSPAEAPAAARESDAE